MISISSSINSYSFLIQRGILQEGEQLKSHLMELGSCFALITNDSLRTLYGESLKLELVKAGLDTHLFSFPTGEHYKTRETKESLENALFEKELGKDCCILALGGGVVTDLVGYLASTYCRGVPLVLIPTGLLGMVDACIGGKTGVNTPYGKNLIGTIYPPKKVLIDPSILQTLSLREIRGGVVEIIKHALISSSSLFVELETHAHAILTLQHNYIDSVIAKSCLIKKKIVEQDEREKGKRHLLNLGHTVGHALELLSNYSLSHGEAVAIGLLIEAEIAIGLGALKVEEGKRIYSILKLYGLPLKIPPSISVTNLLKVMILDKKTLNHKPRFVVLNGIGSTKEYEKTYCTSVDEALIVNAFNKVNHALYCH